MIYAYSTPEIARHDGWVKIGYTDSKTVDERIKEQTYTSDTTTLKEWEGAAIYDDGTYETFTDRDFHRYLEKNGVERRESKEWFHIDGVKSREYFDKFRQRKVSVDDSEPERYELRKEQKDAVEAALDYASSDAPSKEFLWNAKPRFGKTLSVYDFIMCSGARRTLIVTNRPAVANSWYDDFEKFFKNSGYFFVSDVEALKTTGKDAKPRPHLTTRAEYEKLAASDAGAEMGLIEFVSLQDLKGSLYFGGEYDKLQHIETTEWDALVIDEAHEGVDTEKTDDAFDRITRKFTLHLSGTPFKEIAKGKFDERAIFYWTYADEQRAKRDWDEETSNPYEELPELRLFTYQMSEIVRDKVEEGIEIDGEKFAYAFDLNEFFKTKSGDCFVYEESVDRFLDALTTQEKYPFSTPELRDELRHTFWLLTYVSSAKALAKKLRAHPVFCEYEIVLAAGDGTIDSDDAREKAFDKVRKAVKNFEKTITLSVGQLTTGVTIPEWSATLILSNVKSPALYMQTAFRAQNPYSYSRQTEGNQREFYRKTAAYVFDFDPARTLSIYEQFANDLYSETSDGRGDFDARKENVREALNFFPVVGEDENGEMIELDAEKVLSIPRKIRCREVVRSGFTSNFLFQNISNVFRAPQEVIDVIQKFTPVKEQKNGLGLDETTGANLFVNEDGEVDPPDEIIVGTETGLFGEMIFADAQEIDESLDKAIRAEVEKGKDDDPEQAAINYAREAFIEPALEKVRENCGAANKAEITRLKKKCEEKVKKAAHKPCAERAITLNKLERERDRALANADSIDERRDICAKFAEEKKRVDDETRKNLATAIQESRDETLHDAAKAVATLTREKEKDEIETRVRDRLRGFSRTIPSFLMAYGDDYEITLATFDKIVPNDVFLEVTGVTLEQFAFLRDGGEYVDEKTGETRTFEGRLFDPVVFDDSVKEFARLKKELSNYFDESNERDIFDYVPPQRTNQIFTPKKVVAQMVDLLEQEDPGCFDRDDKTFADLYMKSGLYVAEIVKRLYRNEKMKERYPDDFERLKHIFERQVYGLAPTEIIYQIATHFLFGFDEERKIDRGHFKKLDALPYAKGEVDQPLSEKLDELFGD